MIRMSVYVDYVYRAGELYANEDLTALIGLEDSAHAPVLPLASVFTRQNAHFSRDDTLV